MRGGASGERADVGGRIVGLVVVVGTVLIYGLWLRRYGLDVVDEGTLLAQFDRVQRGQMPYRDFHTGYGPSTFFLNAGLLRAAGTDVVTVRTGLLAVHAVGAGLLYWLASAALGAGLGAAAVAVVWGVFRPVAPGVFATFNVPYPGWYAEALGYGALALVAGRVGRSAIGLAAVGVLWGLVFSLKQNVAVLGLAGTLVYLALRPKEDELDHSVGWGLVLAVAMVAGLLVFASQGPMTAWEVCVHGLPLCLLAAAVVRAHPGAALYRDGVALAAGFAAVVGPLIAALVSVAGFDAVLAGLLHVGSGAAGVFRETHPVPAAMLDPLARLSTDGLSAVRELSEGLWMIALPVAAIVGALDLLRAPRGRPTAHVLLACVGPLLYLQLFPRADFRHLLPVAGPLVVVGLGLLAGGPSHARRRILVGAAVVVLVCARMLPTVPTLLEMARPSAGDVPIVPRASIRWDLVRPEYLRRIPDVAQALTGAESLVGFPALGFLNFAVGAQSPLRHDYFFPGVPDAGESQAVVDRLAQRPPEAALLLDAPLAFFPDAFVAHAGIVEALRRERVALPATAPYWVGRRAVR